MEGHSRELLERLRSIFLDEKPEEYGDYWDSEPLLQVYDETLGRRIRWKWDSILQELRTLGWSFPQCEVLDWGCGSGVASEAVLSHYPEAKGLSWYLHDRSARALGFATKKLSALGVSAKIGLPKGEYVLVVSHVVNELSQRRWEEFVEIAMRSRTLLWAEPGTPVASRRIIELRERMLARNPDRTPIAPCPHSSACGLKNPGKDWCHFFAKVPPEIHQNSEWRRLANEVGIDLRSLPVSYLCVDSKGEIEKSLARRGRLLGRPRIYKGYATATICRESGVGDERFLKRDKEGPYRIVEEAGFSVSIPDKTR